MAWERERWGKGENFQKKGQKARGLNFGCGTFGMEVSVKVAMMPRHESESCPTSLGLGRDARIVPLSFPLYHLNGHLTTT